MPRLAYARRLGLVQTRTLRACAGKCSRREDFARTFRTSTTARRLDRTLSALASLRLRGIDLSGRAYCTSMRTPWIDVANSAVQRHALFRGSTVGMPPRTLLALPHAATFRLIRRVPPSLARTASATLRIEILDSIRTGRRTDTPLENSLPCLTANLADARSHLAYSAHRFPFELRVTLRARLECLLLGTTRDALALTAALPDVVPGRAIVAWTVRFV